MDQNEQHFQSPGICHRLYYFIMRTLAAQALKPVTLGQPVSVRKTNWSGGIETGTRDDSVNAGDYTENESLASVDIQDEASLLLRAEEGGWLQNKPKPKAPRKTVNINEEPEIITACKKRKKNGVVIERKHDGELRPLRSILKVGSNLSETSVQSFNVNPK